MIGSGFHATANMEEDSHREEDSLKKKQPHITSSDCVFISDLQFLFAAIWTSTFNMRNDGGTSAAICERTKDHWPKESGIQTEINNISLFLCPISHCIFF